MERPADVVEGMRFGFLQVKGRSLSLPGLPGIIIVVVQDRRSALVKLSFLFRYLERLVRRPVYLFQDQEGRRDCIQLDHHAHKVFREVVPAHSARLQNI